MEEDAYLVLGSSAGVVGSDDGGLVRWGREDLGEACSGVEASERSVDHDFGGERLGGSDGEDVLAATGVLYSHWSAIYIMERVQI